MVLGWPRRAMIVDSSRVTRMPDREVSAIKPRHSRLKSSTMARTRNLRPSVNASETKSRLPSSGRRLRSTTTRGSARWTCPAPASTSAPEDPFPAAAPLHLQFLFRVEAPDLLLVYLPALALQHHMHTPVAKAAALIGHSLHGIA